MKLEVLTPENQLFAGEVVAITACALDGELGILDNHAALTTVLKKGPFRFRTSGNKEERIELEQGILKIKNNLATALVYTA